MNEWLRIFVAVTFAGSVVLLLSILITIVIKGSFVAKYNYWNRKLSLFFFLVPVFMIFEFFSESEKVNHVIHDRSMALVHLNSLSVSLSFVKVLFAVWMLGVIIRSVWILYSYWRFKGELRKSYLLVPKKCNAQQLLLQNMTLMHLSKDIKIVYSKYNISPVLIGLLKPTIILPKYSIPNDELDMIIKHELTHFKKNDLWIKALMLIATILHWYNPLVYLLQKEIHVWSELSCDEDIVMKMSHTERKKYGETILNMIERANQQSKPYFLGAFFSTQQIDLKRRLVTMLNVKKMSKTVIVLSSVGLLTLGGIGIAGSVLAKERAPVVSAINNQDTEAVMSSLWDQYNVQSTMIGITDSVLDVSVYDAKDISEVEGYLEKSLSETDLEHYELNVYEYSFDPLEFSRNAQENQSSNYK